MKVRPFIFVLFLFLGRQTFAQNQNNNWFFGNKGAISFVNGSPQAQITSQMTTIEGCASVSDPSTGKLLFYTNGIQIWNSKNNIMPNGNGLLAGSATSATQGVMIVPFPTKKNLYYVFTVDETSNGAANGLRYSIVDLNLNNGLGDIVTNQKNILIQTNSTERMAVVKNAAENGYWLVVALVATRVWFCILRNNFFLSLGPLRSMACKKSSSDIAPSKLYSLFSICPSVNIF
jgi:hypothetical protein